MEPDRFEQSPHSCFIYTCNVCVNAFGADADFGPIFADAFRRLSAATFALLAGGQARHLPCHGNHLPAAQSRRDLGAISARSRRLDELEHRVAVRELRVYDEDDHERHERVGALR